MKTGGIGAFPVDITELYSRTGSLALRWDGVYTLTNLMALRQMRKLGEPTAQQGK